MNRAQKQGRIIVMAMRSEPVPQRRRNTSRTTAERKRVDAAVRRIKRRHEQLRKRVGVLSESWPIIRKDRER